MNRIRIVLTIFVAAIFATACQGNEPQDIQEELQQTRQRSQDARSKIEDLKQSRRDLAKQAKKSAVRAAELEALVRELSARDSSSSCPIESAPRKRPDVRAVAFAYGEGPVFVGLGTGDGIVLYTVDTMQHKGWYYYKTLWAVAPSYNGEVVITGKQIDGSHRLRFSHSAGFPGKKQLQLRFSPNESRGWRYGPSDTLIRSPGCYAFRAKSDDFEQTIIFMAIG